MARRRFGIFKKEAEDQGNAEAPEAEAEAGGASPFSEQPSDTAVFEPVSAGDDDFAPPWSGGEGDTDSPTDSAEWEVPLEMPAAAALDPEPRENGDSGFEPPTAENAERIRVAAQTAAEQAEDRAMDEILALESDLEKAKDEAAGHLRVIEGRLGDAERRAGDAERRAEQAERRVLEAEARIEHAQREAAERAEAAASAEPEDAGATEPSPDEVERIRAEAEDQAREAAANWVRDQLESARAEIERLRAEAAEAAKRAQAASIAGASPKIGGARRPEPVEGPASIAELAAEAEALAAEADAPTRADGDLEPPAWLPDEPEADAGLPAPEAEDDEPQEDHEPGEREPEDEPELEQPDTDPPPIDSADVPEGMISLNLVEFEDLRKLGMSVTQAKRVLRYRDEHGGFTSVDELDDVPGFPRSFLTEIKDRIVP